MRKIILLTCFLLIADAYAGPPYLSDDPDAVAYKNIEIYLFSTTEKVKTSTNIEGPAIEIHYGILPNLDINMIAGLDTEISHDGEDHGTGLEDTKIGVIYSFLQETRYLPRLGLLPSIYLPTGSSDKGVGNGRAFYTLGLWAEKSFNAWIINFGGNYMLNPAPDQLNNFSGGFLLQNKWNDKWIMGAEIFIQGATDTTSPATTIVDAGATYVLTKNTYLLFSAGHSIKGMQDFVSYAGFEWCMEAGC